MTKNNNFLQAEPLAPFGRVDFGEIKLLILGLILNIFRIVLQKNTKNNNFQQAEPLAPFGRVDFGEIKLLILALILNILQTIFPIFFKK